MGRLLGHDYLGGKHYLSAILRAHPEGWAAGIFLRTFGDARKEIESMVRSKRISEIVIHLASFDRTHRYPVDSLKAQIQADAKWCEQLARKHKHTTILISPYCEHNHGAATMRCVFADLRKIAPSCLMVNSIWKGAEVPGTITEIHLENSKPKSKPKNKEYIVAFDGFGGQGEGDFSDADIDTILARYPDARQIRAWNFRYNGKFGHQDPAPVDRRKHWPNADYIRGHTEIMLPRTSVPSWPDNALMKPFADDHGEGGKDNKLMIIIPESAPEVEVLDAKGKVIDRPKRFLPDHSGEPRGPRYYSSRYAYQVADIARRGAGTDLVTVRVKVGSKYKYYPATDAGKRSGRFR